MNGIRKSMLMTSKRTSPQLSERTATVPSSFCRAWPAADCIVIRLTSLVSSRLEFLRQLEVPFPTDTGQHARVRIHVVLRDEVSSIHHVIDVEIGTHPFEDAIGAGLYQRIARQPDASRQGPARPGIVNSSAGQTPPPTVIIGREQARGELWRGMEGIAVAEAEAEAEAEIPCVGFEHSAVTLDARDAGLLGRDHQERAGAGAAAELAYMLSGDGAGQAKISG